MYRYFWGAYGLNTSFGTPTCTCVGLCLRTAPGVRRVRAVAQQTGAQCPWCLYHGKIIYFKYLKVRNIEELHFL